MSYIGFKKLKAKLARRKGIYSPGGLAHAIGVKKYGKKAFAKMSAAGRRRMKRNCGGGRPYKRNGKPRVRRNFNHKRWMKVNTLLGIAASAFVVYHYVKKYSTKGSV